jgi:uncharacterized membrane protein (UPF0136 family)
MMVPLGVLAIKELDPMADIAPYSILGLAVIVLLGGVMGFVKAKSKPSLIAGVISALLLGACFYMSTTSLTNGLAGALIMTAVLDLVFAMRFKKTGKFMPAGMMLIVLLVFQVIFAMAIVPH